MNYWFTVNIGTQNLPSTGRRQINSHVQAPTLEAAVNQAIQAVVLELDLGEFVTDVQLETANSSWTPTF